MLSINFAPELITAVAAMVMSLIFSYIPPLAEKYAGLKSYIKSLIMVVLMMVVTAVIVLLVQYGYITSAEPITWEQAVYCFILALIANSTAYTLSPQTPKVVEIKAERDKKLTAKTAKKTRNASKA